MTVRRLAVALVVVLAVVTGCRKAPLALGLAGDSAILNERTARLDSSLAHLDSISVGTPLALWKLPAHLNEISGLVLTANGRLLTHGDERGKVFEVDYRRGIVVKEFTVGSPPVHGDFESIAIDGDTVMLFTSDGILYRFAEGADQSVVPYTRLDTELGSECEFESMAFDAPSRSLLLACKKVHDKALKDSLVIFRYPLAPGPDGRKVKVSHLAVAIATVVGTNGWEGFHPSDMALDPVSGNYVLLASLEKGLAEITPAGEVIFARALPPGHAQPEGLALTKDHLLIISDEAKGGPAAITLYRWP
jgi:hypothetical protein